MASTSHDRIEMRDLDVSLVMAQAALGVKNSAIGGSADLALEANQDLTNFVHSLPAHGVALTSTSSDNKSSS